MRKFVLLFAVLVGCVVVSSHLTPAFAQANRTWVSGVGTDTGSCTRTAPCASFAYAITQTNAGGEINCLDSGGFGGVTITKSISIICQVGTAGVLVSSAADGIVVNAASTDVVFLSGLDIQGINSGLSGVNIQSAKAVIVVDCIIRGFNTAGINASPPINSLRLEVIESVIADNAGTGILNKPSGSASILVMVDRTKLLSNGGDGIMANGTLTSGSLKVSIRDSKSALNAHDGYVAFSSGATAQIMIDFEFGLCQQSRDQRLWDWRKHSIHTVHH